MTGAVGLWLSCHPSVWEHQPLTLSWTSHNSSLGFSVINCISITSKISQLQNISPLSAAGHRQQKMAVNSSLATNCVLLESVKTSKGLERLNLRSDFVFPFQLTIGNDCYIYQVIEYFFLELGLIRFGKINIGVMTTRTGFL